jgi:hypothetical protein
MTSWRESVPEPVQEHIDGLINVALDAASEFLDKSGEFFPFGLAVGEDGEISMFGVDPGLGEHPESTDVLRSLGDVARGERERFQAVAFTADVSLQDGSDAVRVQLEHREGVVLEIVAPYRRRRFTGRVTLDQGAVSRGTAQVWMG